MADNLFKDSDPNCGVPEVPVVDFKFVDDCFIPPTPPPIFECLPVTVPNEPCISCPTFDGGGTINVGYPSPGELCPKEPRIEVKVEKKGDACEYDLTVDLDIPIPRPPCPKINVNSFEVQTRFNSPGCCTEYETDVNIDTFDEIGTLDSETIPPKTIVRAIYEGAANIITVETIEDRNALLTDGPPELTPETVVKVLQPEVTAWKLTTIFNEDAGYLTWMATGLNEFAKYYINDGTAEEPSWRELVPENSPEVCENSFTVTSRHRDPVDCDDPGECEFDLDLKIAIPIPRIPCPEINVTTFSVGSSWEREDCCQPPRNVGTIAERNSLSLIEAPIDSYVQTDEPLQIWKRTEGGWTTAESDCPNRFVITTRHEPPIDCNDPGKCIFDIELEIHVPLPPIPCPSISGDVETSVGYEGSACVECVSDATVRNQSELSTITGDDLIPGMYVSVKEGVSFYKLEDDLTTWTPVGYDRPLKSTEELDSIPVDERDDVSVALTDPPSLYRYDSNTEEWKPIYAPKADATVASTSERNNLDETAAPLDSIVRITGSGSTPTTFWRRDGVNDWSPVSNPVAEQSVNTVDDLDNVEDYSNGTVVEIKDPPDRFVFDDGKWRPQNLPPDRIIVYSEEHLDTVGADEREAGMIVQVKSPINRYQLVSNDGTPVWKPAKCLTNKLEVISRKKKPKDCKDPGQCIFDIVLEIVVPVPKPPCPEIVVDDFKVTTGFTGGSDGAPSCADCPPPTAEAPTYAAAALLASEAALPPGSIIQILEASYWYKLDTDLETWLPVQAPTVINVPNTEALEDMIEAGEYPTGDPLNPTAPLEPGQRFVVADPDDLYKLNYDLVTWEPERERTQVPPTKLVTVSSLDEMYALPAGLRFNGLYARITAPETEYTLGADGTFVEKTVPEISVETEEDRDAIPTDERFAGMLVFVRAMVTRVRVNEDGSISASPCPQNRFTITPRVKKNEDCNTPDECSFDVDLEIVVPIPRTPCPIINVGDVEVRTKFVDNKDDEECCIDPSPAVIIDFPNIDDVYDAPLDVAPVGSYARVTPPGAANSNFYKRTGCKNNDWTPTEDPTEEICDSRLTVTQKHRCPEDCQDPGQCEFDVDLYINVPIPRVACPTVGGKLDVSSGYEDSECVGCESDMTVKDQEALDGIPEDQLEEGMYVKVEDAVTALVWDGEEWQPAAKDTTSEPDDTVANWEAVLAYGQPAPEDGTILEITDPPNEFIIGVGAQQDDNSFIYDWEPLYGGISGSSQTFNSVADRDAAFRGEYVGYHSVVVKLLNPPTRYRYDANRLDGQLPPGWVGFNTSNDTPDGEVVKDENEARAKDPEELVPGTVVTLDNPTNRYKYVNGQWVPAPCPKSSIRIKTKHREPEDCDDPGECAFDVEIDVVVPIPRPPCPEININDFTVDVKDKDCVEEKDGECEADQTVDSLEDLDALTAEGAPPLQAGTKVFVASENKTYKLGDNQQWEETEASAAGDCCTNRFSITTRHEDNKVRKTLDSEEQLNDKEVVGDIEPGQVVAVKKEVTGTAESADDLPDGVDTGAIYTTPGEGGKFDYWEKQADGSWAATAGRKFYRRGPKKDDKAGNLNWSEIALDESECNAPEKCIFDVDLNLCIKVPVPCPQVNAKTKTNVGYAGHPCVSCESDINVKNKDNFPPVGVGTDIPPEPEDCDPRDGQDDEYKNDFYATTTQVQSRFQRTGDEFESIGYVIPVNRPEDIANIPPEDLEGAQISIQDPPKLWQRRGGKWVPLYPQKPSFGVDNSSDLGNLPDEQFPPGSVVNVGGVPYERQPGGGWAKAPDYNDVPSVDQVSDLNDIEGAAEGDIVHVDNPTSYYTPGPNGELNPDERETDWYVFEESDLGSIPTGDKSPVKDGGIVEVAFPTDRWQLVSAPGAGLAAGTTLYSWMPARCPKNQFKIVSQKKKSENCDESTQCILHFFTEVTVPIPVPPCPVFNSNVKAKAFYENCSTCDADLEFETVDGLLSVGPFGRGPDSIEECADVPESSVAEGTTAFVKSNDTRWRWLTQYGGWWPASCGSEMYIISKKNFGDGECDEPPTCEFDVVVDINVPIPTPPCPIFNIKRNEVNVCDAGAPTATISINKRKEVQCKEDQPEDEKSCDDKGCIFDFDFKLDIPCPILRSGGVTVMPVPPNHPGGFGGSVIVGRSACEAVPPAEECPEAAATVQDALQLDRYITQQAITNNPDLANGMVARILIPQQSGPPAVRNYSFQGGAECGPGSWERIDDDAAGTPSHTIVSNGEDIPGDLSNIVEQIIATASAGLVGTVVETLEPLPNGNYWEYLGGLEDRKPQWELIPCQDEPSPICAFDFSAVISVPFCEPKMLEDDDKGTHTGVEKFDAQTGKPVRHRTYHIKPDELCPIGRDPLDLQHPVLQFLFAPCPDDGEELDNFNDLVARAGKLPGTVEWRKQGPDGEQVINVAVGVDLRFVTQKPQPGGPATVTYYVVKAGNGFVAQRPRNPKLPLTVEAREMPAAQAAGLPVLDLGEVNNSLGEAPQVQDGEIYKIKGGPRIKVVILDPITREPNPGAELDPFIQNVRWEQLQCSEEEVRLVVQPDKFAPCTLRYVVVSRTCQRHADHIAQCTEYFGEPCCDTDGCPCENPINCCDESAKEDYDDGSKDTGSDYYGIDPPTEAAPFTAGPWQPVPAAPTRGSRAPADLPIMRVEDTGGGTGGDEPPTGGPDGNPDVPDDDPCVVAAVEAGTGCAEEPPTDKGYRPYKSLELRINEEYDEERLKPPKVTYNLEAAMNCLHGGIVKVKKGSRNDSGGGATGATGAIQQFTPGAVQSVNNPRMANSGATGATGPAGPSTPCAMPSGLTNDDLGWGCIRIENNRVNLDITLFAETCEDGGSTGPTSAFTARPVAANTAPNDLTPALLESFIRAINTNPELKAAIRNIVNQPD